MSKKTQINQIKDIKKSLEYLKQEVDAWLRTVQERQIKTDLNVCELTQELIEIKEEIDNLNSYIARAHPYIKAIQKKSKEI